MACSRLLLEGEHVLQAAFGRGTCVASCCWKGNMCCRLILEKEHMLERKCTLLEAVGKSCCRLLLDRECMLQAAVG